MLNGQSIESSSPMGVQRTFAAEPKGTVGDDCPVLDVKRVLTSVVPGQRRSIPAYECQIVFGWS